MKTSIRSGGLFVLLVCAAGIAAAQPDRLRVDGGRFVAVVMGNQSVVTGEVTARTDTELTVLSPTSQLTTLQVTQDTTIIKGAVTIRLADISVGDKVSVTAERAPDGKLRAVSVNVRVGNE